MLRKKTVITLAFTCLAVMSGCGTTDEAPTGSTGAAATAFKNLSATVNKLAINSPGALNLGVASPAARSEFGISTLSDWTTAAMGDPRNSGGSCQYTTQISPQTFMTIDTNKDSVRCNGSSVNVFGRIQTAFSVACAFAHMIPDAATSADLPSSGSKTYTMDSSQFSTMIADCPGLQLDGVTSLSFTVNFSTPADTTYFDRSFDGTASFETAAGPQSSALDTVMMKFNSSITAVAMKEHNGNGSTRTVVIHDLTNNVMKAEYMSGPNSNITSSFGLTLHRLIYDGANNYGRIYTSIEGYASQSTAGSSPSQINSKYVMTLNPDDLTQPATIGMTFTGGSTVTLKACLNLVNMDATDGGTVTSGKFSCSGVEGVATSLMTVDAAGWDYVRANWDTWEALSSSPSLAWNKDTMYTLVPAQF